MMLTVGSCPICEEGPLGLRRCGECERLVILCDECDAAWVSANLEKAPAYADEEAMPCPHCASSLWEGESRWATRDDALATEWITNAIDNGLLQLPEPE